MKRKREETNATRCEEGFERSSEDQEVQPSIKSEMQLQLYYEEASRCKEKWELEERCKELEKKCEDLSQQKQIAYDNFKSTTSVTEETLSNDDKKVRYYAGLPSYPCLKAVFDYVCLHWSTKLLSQ